LNPKRFELPFFPKRRNKGIPSVLVQNQQFLGRPHFNSPTTAMALFLKYPRFTCKKYFKPRFRFILSGKVTFNQIWTFRPRKWNILTTLLTILLALIWSKQRNRFLRQSNLVNCVGACSRMRLQLVFTDVLFNGKKLTFVPCRLLTFECNRNINHITNCKLTQRFFNRCDLHQISIT